MERLIAGAMSGTSADGVDVAVVRVSGRGTEMSARVVAHHHHAYATPLRKAIFSLRGEAPVRLADLARVTREISLAYAAGVKQVLAGAGVDASQVAAVAAHGQTMFHAPPDTLQVLDPALLAAEVDCAVVSDFRRADCAAGGQGAPLVPFADYVLFRHPAKSRALLNIGGIANVTFIPAGATLDEVVAFDTGPGNCLSDDLCRRYDPGGPGYDPNGRRAEKGKVMREVVEAVMAHPYFGRRTPKSTDVPEMLQVFQPAVAPALAAAGAQVPLNDLLATACAVTARSIGRALPPADELFAAGGGIYNRTLMLMLADENVSQRAIQEAGADFDPTAKEAVAFALLGAATLDGEPSNVPSATGARRRVVLGSITPRP